MSELDALLRDLLGPGVAFAWGAPGDTPVSALHPLEAATVERAVAKRQREVASGRAAARRALAALGYPEMALPRGNGGQPLWPRGVVGSITHTDTLTVAAVALCSHRDGLGIDAEPDGPLEPDLWPAITTEEELAALRALPPHEAGAHARWIFCAKEAAYKCQYPSTGLLLDFGDLQIRWSGATPAAPGVRAFEAVYQRHAAPFQRGDRIPGRSGRAAGHILAAAWLGEPRTLE
jgi:4'-phosphopantetheinyl transferase EntD